MKHTLTASILIGFGLTLVASGHERAIVTFDQPNAIERWDTVNDGVMGGVSVGQADLTDRGTLLFSGILSLENNGGFASIRTQPAELDLAGASAIAVQARGDGRSYWVDLRRVNQRGATSYRAPLPTTSGEWTEVVIPIADFQFQSFGRPRPADPIRPADIASVGFMLSDKKPGPFRVEIKSIKAVFDEPTGNTIVDVATSAGMFQTLLAAAAAADLDGVLAGEGPFTVFAPTDDAFGQLPTGTVEELLKPENKQRLAAVLKYHVLEGTVTLAQALASESATSLHGAALPIAFQDGRVQVGSANLVTADINASNGIVHVIDQVLLPPDGAPAPLTPRGFIELAIDRGVPLFNHGNPAACAAVYELTAHALRTMSGLDHQSATDLNQALRKVGSGTSPTEAAWTLRHALDRVYARLSAVE